MLTSHDPTLARTVHRKVNGCLTPVFALDGCSVTTVEGLITPNERGGSGVALRPADNLHPTQLRIAELHGSQCGFCTPGMVMALFTYLKNNPEPSAAGLEQAYDGNLCRCTGYRPLLDAAKSFAVDKQALRAACAPAAEALQARPSCSSATNLTDTGSKAGQFAESYLAADARLNYPGKRTPTREQPPDSSLTLRLVSPEPGALVHAPASLTQLLQYRAEHPAARVFQGNMDAQYWVRHRYQHWLSTTRVARLSEVEMDRDQLRIGSGVLVASFVEKVQELLGDRLESCAGLAMITRQMLQCFTSQLRNAASIGSTVGARDIAPVLVAAHAELQIGCLDDNGRVTMRRVTVGELFDGPGGVYDNLAENELLIDLIVPLKPPGVQRLCSGFKQAGRRENSVGYVAAGFCVDLDAGFVHQAVVAVGGMGQARMRRFKRTEAALQGRKWDAVALAAALDAIVPDAAEDSFEGRDEYKAVLLLSALEQFWTAGSSGEMEPATSERHITVGAQSWDSRTDTSTLQTTVGMSACDGFGDLEQPGIAARLTQVDRGHADNTTHAFHLITLASNERHIKAPHVELDPFNTTCAPVGDPVQHAAAYAQTAGEAVYVDDIPVPNGCLFGAIVTSPAPFGKITAVPVEEALQLTGRRGAAVRGYFDLRDAAGSKVTKGMRFRHTSVEHTPFATGYLMCIGATVGMVVADTQDLANRAAALISNSIEYYEEGDRLPSPLAGAVFTIDEAIEKEAKLAEYRKELHSNLATLEGEALLEEACRWGLDAEENQTFDAESSANRKTSLGQVYDEMFSAYYPYTHNIVHGKVDDELEACETGDGVVVSGTVRVGGQEHFYLEPHCLMMVPGEHGEMTVFSMTQCVQKTQRLVASAIGVPCAKVVVKVKRMGGAFGGKETLSAYLTPALAIAAAQLRRPVRLLLTRDLDMNISGQRHPFKYEYRAGFSKDGIFQALDVRLWNNGGASSEISREVMDRGMFHAMNAYNVRKAFRTEGFACKTNITSNTAFRGFGATQTMLMTETVMEQAAIALGITREQIVQRNLLHAGAKLPYGQLVPQCHLSDMWQELCGVDNARLAARRAEILSWNQSNERYKKGLAVVPTMYGINFPVAWLNQGAALVLVYTDGSVLVRSDLS